MKISICITVLNEENSIELLLHSLLNQTRKPDEIIIVDGGSVDRTNEIVNKFKLKSRRIKLFTKKGNIAQGRNFGIKNTKGEIIAITDGGCIPKKDWLQKITEPFKKSNIEIVAGFYDMAATSNFQKAITVYMGIPPERFDKNSFLPSARSVSFKKSLWKELGGFDESLVKAGEDTSFFYQAVKKGMKIIRVKEARVVWMEMKNMTLSKAFKKFFDYAKGDGEAGIWWHPAKRFSSHNIKILTIYARYFVFMAFLIFVVKYPNYWLIFLLLVTVYCLLSIYKWRDVIKDTKTRVWLPVIQFLSDFAVMSGFFVGTIKTWVIKK
jgi:glycosyltransferase involved in cell wall biosynthesis